MLNLLYDRTTPKFEMRVVRENRSLQIPNSPKFGMPRPLVDRQITWSALHKAEYSLYACAEPFMASQVILTFDGHVDGSLGSQSVLKHSNSVPEHMHYDV